MPPGVGPETLRNIRILIETAREFAMPVVISEQYPAGLGHIAPEIQAILSANTPVFEKLVFSCCAEPALASFLERFSDKDVILCGAEAHVCVLQTGLDLLAQGHRVFVSADAVCSRAPLNEQLGLDMLRQAGAVIGTTEIFAFGFLGGAGTEIFKRISRMVK